MDIYNCCKLCISLIHILVFLFGTPPPPQKKKKKKYKKKRQKLKTRAGVQAVAPYYHIRLIVLCQYGSHDTIKQCGVSLFHHDVTSPNSVFSPRHVFKLSEHRCQYIASLFFFYLFANDKIKYIRVTALCVKWPENSPQTTIDTKKQEGFKQSGTPFTNMDQLRFRHG